MMHGEKVVVVYCVERQDQVEADHVENCDETLAPKHLSTVDTEDIRQGLRRLLEKLRQTHHLG